jgi:tetratricopeptide (TPR) repeat protein
MIAKVQQGNWLPPRQIKPDVPRALEAIYLKAMALKPEDRYPTALLLAQDVEHWLADEPVAAYQEPWSARMRRWSRRHRPLVVGAAALLLAAVPLSLVIAVNRQQALQQAETDKREIARQKDIAQANENAATKRETETKAVLDFVENKIFAAARPEGEEGGLGHAVTLRRAMEAALPYVAKSFTDQPLIEARLRLTLGTSFAYLGDATTAEAQYEAASALYARHLGADNPQTLRSMTCLANSYSELARNADALKLREKTLALQKATLGPDHPDTLTSMNNLGETYFFLDRRADALKLFEDKLVLRKTKLGPDHPDTLQSMANLAQSYAKLDRLADCLKLHEEILPLRKAKLGPDHPATLKSMHNLAQSYLSLDRPTNGTSLRRASLSMSCGIAGKEAILESSNSTVHT